MHITKKLMFIILPNKWRLIVVLFALLAERYEMRSVLITSNLVFVKWNTIFKDNMNTLAAIAIDRLVDHSRILELNTESYRIATAKQKKLIIKSEDIM